SILLIVMVILGGVGTVFGPIIGAAVVVLVENVLSNSVERWPTVLGLIFILVILFARAGIVGSAGKLIKRMRRASGSTQTPAPPWKQHDLSPSSGEPMSERNHTHEKGTP